MNEEKITVSLDETNSAKVDFEIHRQDIASRMSEHQAHVEADAAVHRRMPSMGGFFRRSIVYMTIAGIVSALLAWGCGEFPLRAHERAQEDLNQLLKCCQECDQLGIGYLAGIKYYRTENPELQNNPYFQDSFWEQSEESLKRAFSDRSQRQKRLYCWWYLIVGLFSAVGLSVAEPIASKNMRNTIRNGVVGLALGLIGAYLVSCFIDDIYHYLGGGQGYDALSFKQIFARGVGWSLLGLFLAIAPGILMKSWKKFLLGSAGGAIGGLLGGVLFDPICAWTGSVILARCVNILGLVVGAAVATTLLEDLAKQGWLKVATGIITGKQFILYRNPTIIGSSPKSEIYLFKDPAVAPKHAAINGVGGAFLLTALNDSQVLVNGVPVRQQKLKTGDQIRIGQTVFLFEARSVKGAR